MSKRMEDKMVKWDREKVAKWLHSVIENGEPYDSVENMGWDELAPQPMYQSCVPDAMRDLADKLLLYLGG